jgi:D-alanine-D-alanine ligase
VTVPVPARVLILHNSVTAESSADARDILDQITHVQAALTELGHPVATAAVSLDLAGLRRDLGDQRPDVVFNLVEAIDDSGQLVPVAAALLDHLGIPYTGSSTEALVVTSQKVLTKRWLRALGLPTADWWQPGDPLPVDPAPGPWIVKPLWEDASIGMDDASVVGSFGEVAARLAAKQRQRACPWFAERYIEGRELNVGLLAGASGPQVLPVPEIEFVDFPAGKPRIVGYAAKWDEGSFECRNTRRRFVDARSEAALCAALGRLALECWQAFDLAGYARVDFRVDSAGNPWILEINANPCIAPDAGFAAAAAEAGLAYRETIRRIVAAALAPGSLPPP